MNITISFNEIKDIVAKKTNGKIDIDFAYVDYRTMKVSCKPMPFLPTVNVDFMVAKADNSQIVLSYMANNAVDMIIKGLSKYLENQIPKEVVEFDMSVQCICINLDKIEQLQKTLEIIELKQISFERENINVELNLKIN